MKPLVILILFFLLALTWMKLFRQHLDFSYAGRIAMSTMLLFTSIGHFKFSKGMQMMIPSFVPAKETFVIITGVIEILAAIGLMLPSPWSNRAAWFLIAFFVLLLPANIYAATKHVDYEKGTYAGPGPNYLWFRVPLQILFIFWLYFFAIKANYFFS